MPKTEILPLNEGRWFDVFGLRFRIPEDIVSQWDVGKLPTVMDIGVRVPRKFTLPKTQKFDYLVVIGGNGGWPLSHPVRLAVRFDSTYRRLPISPMHRRFPRFGELGFREMWIQAVPIGFRFKEMEFIGIEAEPKIGLLAGILLKGKVPKIREFLKTRKFFCAGELFPLKFQKISPNRWRAEVDVPECEHAELEIGVISKTTNLLFIDGELTGASVEATNCAQPITPGHHVVEIETDGKVVKPFLVVYPDGYLKRLEELAEKRIQQLVERAATVPLFRLIAQSHIDVAWLWTKKETHKKVARTLARGMEIAERFPEFPFVQSSPAMFEWLERERPEFFEKVRRAVEDGKVELVGGMWVEPDLNIPSGESLMRQLEYGLEYWRSKFNKDVKIGWILDSFGYPWTLPMIYRKFGIVAMMTAKLSWSDVNRFPFDIFRWRAPDGSEVIVQHARLCEQGLGRCFVDFVGFCDDYARHNSLSERLAGKIFDDSKVYNDGEEEVSEVPPGMILFGEGDGGGGPTVEQATVARKAVESGYFTAGPPDEYFESVAKLKDRLPIWNDELYLETHRATYSRGRRIKELIRACELAAYRAEATAALAGLEFASVKPKLDRAWKLLLINQFHDIASASTTKDAFEEAVFELSRSLSIFESVERQGVAKLQGEERGVLNLLPWRRKDVVEWDGKLTLVEAKPLSIDEPVSVEPPSDFDFELGFSKGKLSSLRFRGRELLRGPIEFQLFRDEHKAAWTWNIDPDYDQNPLPVVFQRLEIDEGDHKETYRFHYRLGERSKGILEFVNIAGRKWLEVNVKLDWHEEFALLKLAFPFDISTDGAVCGIPYGVKKRPFEPKTPMQSAKWEVSVRRFADVSDGRFGVAVFTVSNYGFDLKRGYLRSTLIRSAPVWPYPELDLGEFEMRFAIYPHDGDFVVGDVERTYREFVHPLYLMNFNRPISLVEIEPNPIVSDCVRLTSDNLLHLRLHNPSDRQIEGAISSGTKVVKVSIPPFSVEDAVLRL